MLPELGQVALLLALLFSALQGVVPLLGAHRGNERWMAVARPAALAQLGLVLAAYIALTASFVNQDFSVKYVADNSNSLLPLVYRYTAVWGAHEGSLLLWSLMLAAWNAAVALSSRRLPATVNARVLGVIGLVGVGFLSFMLFTSNPFERLLPGAAEGHDLNPLLQDPGMIIHPPMLYIGYIGFVVPFAFAIAAFSLSLLGAFLVRSGVLTSVHSFAADPTRGLFILAFLGIVIGGALALYVLRAPKLEDGKPFAATSRETLLLINNLLLASACAMVLLGTLYPLLADALGLGKISVGPPYFGTLFLLLMAPLVLLVPFGPLTRWQSEQASKPLAMLAPWFGFALVLGVVAWFMAPQGAWKTGLGVFGAVWVALGTLRFAWTRLKPGSGRFTAEMLGMTLAHLGIAVFVTGAMLVEAQNVLREVPMAPGQTQEIGRYSFRFDGVERVQGPNYVADRGHVQVFRDGKPLELLHPEKRAYASGGQVMTDAGIHAGVRADIFVALGESLGGDTWAVRLHVKPFMRWVWAGALLMALGGFVTATDRRFRQIPKEPR